MFCRVGNTSLINLDREHTIARIEFDEDEKMIHVYPRAGSPMVTYPWYPDYQVFLDLRDTAPFLAEALHNTEQVIDCDPFPTLL